MSVSSLKCSFVITSKCLLSIGRPSFNHPPCTIVRWLDLGSGLGLGLQRRAVSSCMSTRIPGSSFPPSDRPRLRPNCASPMLNVLCGCKQPYLSHSYTLTKFSQYYSTDKQDQEPEKKLSLLARFKQMYRDYWYVLVPVHAVTSLAWFGGFYYLLTSGVDVVGILESYEISEKILSPIRDSSAGYLAVAYAMYKIFTPIRYTVTVGGTTLTINYLKKWGYIRPIPPREKLKEMYQERRDNLKERRASIMESVRGTKEEMMERRDNILESVQATTEELKMQSEFLKKAVPVKSSVRREK